MQFTDQMSIGEVSLKIWSGPTERWPHGGRSAEDLRAMWDGSCPGAGDVGTAASSWFPPKCPPGQLELVSVLSGKAND